MRRGSAAIGSLVFFLVAPGVVVGLIPWWLTGWNLRFDWPLVVRIAGSVVLVAGIAVLVQAFARFVVEGSGRRLQSLRPSCSSWVAGTGTCVTQCTWPW